VDTGALCVRAPVSTGRVGKKHYTTMPFANTARNVVTGARYTLPVITGHHHGPPTRPMNTGVISDVYTAPVNTASVRQP